MHKTIYYYSLILLTSIGCAQKKAIIKTNEEFNPSYFTLGAYDSKDQSSVIKSIIHLKESRKINLDGKEYDISKFESIIDTIKGKYTIKVGKNENRINLVRSK